MYNTNEDLVDQIIALRKRIETLERMPRQINTTIDSGNLVIRQGELQVVHTTPDGDDYTAIQLGGATSDTMYLMDSTGVVVAGFDDAGNGLAQAMTVQSLSVDSVDINDLITSESNGYVCGELYASNTVACGSTELGIMELNFKAKKNHVYRITCSGKLVCATANCRVEMRFRYTTDGTQPTISSAQLDGNPVFAGNTTSGVNAKFETIWTPAQDEQVRVLVTYQNDTGNYQTYFQAGASFPFKFYVMDVGVNNDSSLNDATLNTGGGTTFTTGDPTYNPSTSKTTYKSIWNASWSKIWQGDMVRTDYLRQGYYGGTHEYSMLGFTNANSTGGETGKTIQSALSGASVNKVELYLENVHWYYYAGGIARIGHHGYSSAPQYPQVESGEAFNTGNWPIGVKQWVTLPSSWYSGFASGSYHGVTLGEDLGTDPTYYGKFNADLAHVQLRITYTK